MTLRHFLNGFVYCGMVPVKPFPVWRHRTNQIAPRYNIH